MKTNEIEMTRNGSVISKHPDGVVCTYDTRYRILNVPMEDGSIFELLQERADSGTIRAEYRTELMTIMAPLEELQANRAAFALNVKYRNATKWTVQF